MRARRGFSLIEALIALAIVALTLTLGMSLLAQQAGISSRARAHREALRLVESTLEAVRGGALPLTSGRVQLPVASQEAEAMTLWMEVQPRQGQPGLSDLLVEARYVVKGRALRRQVRTLVWGVP